MAFVEVVPNGGHKTFMDSPPGCSASTARGFVGVEAPRRNDPDGMVVRETALKTSSQPTGLRSSLIVGKIVDDY